MSEVIIQKILYRKSKKPLKELAVDLRKGRGSVLGTQVGKIFQSRANMKFRNEYFMRRYNLGKGDFEIG